MKLDIDRPSDIHRQLLVDGEREPLVTEKYRNVLQSLRDWPDRIILFDVGANIGYYALLAASELGKNVEIYCYEPEPVNVNRLEENIELNGYDNISVVPSAVGDRETSAQLKLHRQSNLHQIESVANRESTGSIEVPVTSLDSSLSDLDPGDNDLVVVRMDIEGYETTAIRGMEDLIASDRPMYLFMEVHSHIGAANQQRIFDQLERSAFELDYANLYYGEEDEVVATFSNLEPVDTSIHLMARRL